MPSCLVYVPVNFVRYSKAKKYSNIPLLLNFHFMNMISFFFSTEVKKLTMVY